MKGVGGGGVGERKEGGGEGVAAECNAGWTNLDGLGLVAGRAGVERLEVLLATTTHDDNLRQRK